MAICSKGFAIIVGDFSNENIHNFQNHLTQKLSALSTHRAGNLLVIYKETAQLWMGLGTSQYSFLTYCIGKHPPIVDRISKLYTLHLHKKAQIK